MTRRRLAAARRLPEFRFPVSMDSDEEAAWLEEEKAIEEEETAQAVLLVEQEETARKRARLEVDFFIITRYNSLMRCLIETELR